MHFSELSLALLGFLTGLSFAAVSPTLPLYVESFGVSYEVLGLFFSAYSLTWGLLQLYTGYLSDRYGRQRFVLMGFALYGLFAVGCAWAQDFLQLLLCRLGQGVGLGLMGPALLGLVAGLKHRGRAFALYRSAQVMGDVIGPVLGGVMGRSGLGRPFLLSAGASGLAVVAALLLREETPGGQAGEKTSFLAGARTILAQRGFLLLCLGAFLAEMGYVVQHIAVPLTGEALGLTPEWIGVVMGVYSLTFVLSQVPLGTLAERTRYRWLLVGCALGGGLGFLGLFFSATGWQMGLAMAVLGVTLGTTFVQSTAWAAELAPVARRSLYLASFDAFIDLSFIVTPALMGPLIRLGVRWPFLFCIPLLGGSGWVLSQVPEPNLVKPEPN